MPKLEQEQDWENVHAKNLYVDIGDCRLDFIGGEDLLTEKSVKEGPIHLHTKPELQYIVSGTLNVAVRESQLLTVSPGSVLLIPPNMLHSSEAQDGSRMVFLFALQQLPQQSDEQIFSEYQYYNSLLGQIQDPIVIKNDVLSYCMEQLSRLSVEPQNFHKIKNLLAFFFIQMCQEAKTYCHAKTLQRPLVPGGRYNQQYFLIEHYINTHYHQKTSTEDIAAILHVSRRQADRIVEQVFGKSYAVLVTERRMSIAEVLLKKTDLSCAQVAEKVGYNSYPGFFLAFKQFFGIAPDVLRE